MKFIIKNIKWIMLISGVLTATMFYGLFAPEAALKSMFGVSFTGTLEAMVVRSWSALIGIMGVVLIYGFFSEKHRVFALSIAALSKAIFVTLVLSYGQQYLGTAMPAIAMDCVVILLAVVFLVAVRMERVVA